MQRERLLLIETGDQNPFLDSICLDYKFVIPLVASPSFSRFAFFPLVIRRSSFVASDFAFLFIWFVSSMKRIFAIGSRSVKTWCHGSRPRLQGVARCPWGKV